MDKNSGRIIKAYKSLVIFIGTLQSGGAERVVSEISSMYANYFDEITILTYYNAAIFYKIDYRVKIECIENKTGTRNKIRNAYWLRQYIKEKEPDVFLSFLMPFNMMAIASLLFTGVKVIVCERQDPSNVKTPIYRMARNFLYHFCSKIEVQTNKGKKYFSKSLQRKISVIPNPNHITPAERKKTITSHKENRVVIVGRLIPLKKHAMLIEVFSKIHKIHPDYKLDIYGEGVLYETLLAQIKQLGLEKNVCLCGSTDNVPSVLKTARIFVLCSNVEGMPNALMEAMALGVPCISTNVSGVSEIISDCENGFIIPVGDAVALERRLLQLIESVDLQKKFSESSSVVMDRFDRNIIFRKWLDLVSF